MNKLTQEQMRAFLEAGYEIRNREFKPGFVWNNNNSVLWIKEILTRAILAMSNVPLGGQIILGVDEDKKNKKLLLNGVTSTQLKSFEDYDGIKGYVDGFSYTNTNFDIAYGEFNSKKFIVIFVQEFDETPVICRKDGQAKNSPLRKDDIYTRSKKGPYSSIRATNLELREIIKLATDKEKADLASRNYKKQSLIDPDKYYKQKVKDLI